MLAAASLQLYHVCDFQWLNKKVPKLDCDQEKWGKQNLPSSSCHMCLKKVFVFIKAASAAAVSPKKKKESKYCCDFIFSSENSVECVCCARVYIESTPPPRKRDFLKIDKPSEFFKCQPIYYFFCHLIKFSSHQRPPKVIKLFMQRIRKNLNKTFFAFWNFLGFLS